MANGEQSGYIDHLLGAFNASWEAERERRERERQTRDGLRRDAGRRVAERRRAQAFLDSNGGVWDIQKYAELELARTRDVPPSAARLAARALIEGLVRTR